MKFRPLSFDYASYALNSITNQNECHVSQASILTSNHSLSLLRQKSKQRSQYPQKKTGDNTQKSSINQKEGSELEGKDFKVSACISKNGIDSCDKNEGRERKITSLKKEKEISKLDKKGEGEKWSESVVLQYIGVSLDPSTCAPRLLQMRNANENFRNFVHESISEMWDPHGTEKNEEYNFNRMSPVLDALAQSGRMNPMFGSSSTDKGLCKTAGQIHLNCQIPDEIDCPKKSKILFPFFNANDSCGRNISTSDVTKSHICHNTSRIQVDIDGQEVSNSIFDNAVDWFDKELSSKTECAKYPEEDSFKNYEALIAPDDSLCSPLTVRVDILDLAESNAIERAHAIEKWQAIYFASAFPAWKKIGPNPQLLRNGGFQDNLFHSSPTLSSLPGMVLNNFQVYDRALAYRGMRNDCHGWSGLSEGWKPRGSEVTGRDGNWARSLSNVFHMRDADFIDVESSPSFHLWLADTCLIKGMGRQSLGNKAMLLSKSHNWSSPIEIDFTRLLRYCHFEGAIALSRCTLRKTKIIAQSLSTTITSKGHPLRIRETELPMLLPPAIENRLAFDCIHFMMCQFRSLAHKFILVDIGDGSFSFQTKASVGEQGITCIIKNKGARRKKQAKRHRYQTESQVLCHTSKLENVNMTMPFTFPLVPRLCSSTDTNFKTNKTIEDQVLTQSDDDCRLPADPIDSLEKRGQKERDVRKRQRSNRGISIFQIEAHTQGSHPETEEELSRLFGLHFETKNIAVSNRHPESPRRQPISNSTNHHFSTTHQVHPLEGERPNESQKEERKRRRRKRIRDSGNFEKKIPTPEIDKAKVVSPMSPNNPFSFLSSQPRTSQPIRTSKTAIDRLEGFALKDRQADNGRTAISARPLRAKSSFSQISNPKEHKSSGHTILPFPFACASKRRRRSRRNKSVEEEIPSNSYCSFPTGVSDECHYEKRSNSEPHSSLSVVSSQRNENEYDVMNSGRYDDVQTNLVSAEKYKTGQDSVSVGFTTVAMESETCGPDENQNSEKSNFYQSLATDDTQHEPTEKPETESIGGECQCQATEYTPEIRAVDPQDPNDASFPPISHVFPTQRISSLSDETNSRGLGMKHDTYPGKRQREDENSFSLGIHEGCVSSPPKFTTSETNSENIGLVGKSGLDSTPASYQPEAKDNCDIMKVWDAKKSHKTQQNSEFQRPFPAPQSDSSAMTILCSESFLETSSRAVAELASGRWANALVQDLDESLYITKTFNEVDGTSEPSLIGLKIKSCDCPLLDDAGVDIELGCQGSIVVVHLSSWNQESSKELGSRHFIRRIVQLAATGRYEQIHIIVCVDVSITSSVIGIAMLQNAVVAQSGCPCEHITFHFVAPDSLSYALAEVVLEHDTVEEPREWVETFAHDADVQERARFFLSIVPTMTVYGALQLLVRYSGHKFPFTNLPPSFGASIKHATKKLLNVISTAKRRHLLVNIEGMGVEGIRETTAVQMSLGLGATLSKSNG